MDDSLEERIATLERAVTDGELDCSTPTTDAAAVDRVADLEGDIEELADRVAELEATTQALRGYVGNLRAVNTEVEEQADLALSKAEATQRAVENLREGAVEPNDSELTDGDHRDHPEKRADTRDRETDTSQRCGRCHQPLGAVSGETHRSEGTSGKHHPSEGTSDERQRAHEFGRETDKTASHHPESPATESRLEELRSDGVVGPVDPDVSPPEAVPGQHPGSRDQIGAHTDGGSPVTSGENEGDSGLIARVRSLL